MLNEQEVYEPLSNCVDSALINPSVTISQERVGTIRQRRVSNYDEILCKFDFVISHFKQHLHLIKQCEIYEIGTHFYVLDAMNLSGVIFQCWHQNNIFYVEFSRELLKPPYELKFNFDINELEQIINYFIIYLEKLAQ